MTLSDLAAVSTCPIYITSLYCSRHKTYAELTNYLRGSSGVMSLKVEKLGAFTVGNLCAYIDLPESVISSIDEDSKQAYKEMEARK